MLLVIIIIILLSVIWIIEVSINEKLDRIEKMLYDFSKHYWLLFTPYDDKKC